MGVVKRQGIKQSIISYSGVLIGALATMFIYPLDKETYGLTQFLIGTAQLLVPLMMLGGSSVVIRFFPAFKDKASGHHGLWHFVHLLLLAGAGLIALSTYIFESQLHEYLSTKPALFYDYAPFVFPLAVFIAFLQLNTSYTSNFKRIAIPAVFQLFIKISLPILILLFYFEKINLTHLIYGIVANYILTNIGILLYNWYLGELHWRFDTRFFTQERLKDIGKYAGFSLLTGIGGVLAFRIDTFMVSDLINFKQNGVYSISVFIGNAIAVPAQALLAIAAPLLADALKKNDLPAVKDIYQRGATNLMWVGLLFFSLVIVSVEDLFLLMPKSEEMQGAFWVVFFIGLARVIDMATSTNSHIISYSNFYHYNLYMIGALAVLNVTFNYLLIPKYQIAGAALATMLSLSIFNFSRLAIIYWKLKISPFKKDNIYTLLLAIIVILLSFYIGELLGNLHAIVKIIAKSAFIALVFIPISLYFKLVPDVNDILLGAWNKFRKKE